MAVTESQALLEGAFIATLLGLGMMTVGFYLFDTSRNKLRRRIGFNMVFIGAFVLFIALMLWLRS